MTEAEVHSAALKLALKFVAPYVLRGDSEESIRRGCGSSSGPGTDGFAVRIGGYACPLERRGDRFLPEYKGCFIKMKPDRVVVERVAGVECLVTFRLSELYRWITRASS